MSDIYVYNELGSTDLIEKTEDEILDEFWNYWFLKMKNKYGQNHYLITKENCIKDWCVEHWAWKKH